MTLIFGQFTTKFNNFSSGVTTPDEFRQDVDHQVLWFIYLFGARFVITYVANVCVTIAAIRTVRALRMAFLESTLRQEVWHFDSQSIGSAASQVTTNGNRVNQGIAEKLAFVFQALSLFFSSFIVALSVQWKLSLITMSIIPAIFGVTGACIAIDAPQEARIVRIYSRASVLAQEAISSIRTVHAFWAQKKMAQKYNEYLQQAHTEGNKKSPNFGVLFSTQYFCVYSAIALSFWQGFRMYQSGEIGQVGQVFT
jgi:ATP-binding cassette, subfamily B (MDR/TAP), member 1